MGEESSTDSLLLGEETVVTGTLKVGSLDVSVNVEERSLLSELVKVVSGSCPNVVGAVDPLVCEKPVVL